jgi:hypothetical protein
VDQAVVQRYQQPQAQVAQVIRQAQAHHKVIMVVEMPVIMLDMAVVVAVDLLALAQPALHRLVVMAVMVLALQ